MSDRWFIYCIENELTHKLYIGITQDVEKRMRRHQYIANGNTPDRSHIHNSIDKYGWDQFNYFILNSTSSRNLAEQEERYYISKFDTFGSNGYNCTKGGDGLKSSEDHPHVKVSDDKFLKIMKDYSDGSRVSDISDNINMRQGAIISVLQGKSRRYLRGKFKERFGYDFKYKDNKKYPDDLVKEVVLEYYNTDNTYSEISRKYSIDYSLIHRWCNGKKRKYIYNNLIQNEVTNHS